MRVTFDQIDPGLRFRFDVMAPDAADGRCATACVAACCREALARIVAPKPRRP